MAIAALELDVAEQAVRLVATIDFQQGEFDIAASRRADQATAQFVEQFGVRGGAQLDRCGRRFAWLTAAAGEQGQEGRENEKTWRHGQPPERRLRVV